ncbi:hypothetical protein BGX21_007071 [Mortierella sp. AD011]|nr:hypothetical protein BGX20_004940 [Mortierella sp. AD010]KAF9398912.1 hypothetical protein BGX21_007071 [Mortierella sp. AD011]
MVDDDELLESVVMETHGLLSKYGSPGDGLPVIKGSAELDGRGSGGYCLPSASLPTNVEVWDDKNVTVYRSNDTHLVHSDAATVKPMVTCIPTASMSVPFVGFGWAMTGPWKRASARSCISGLEAQAGLACDRRHFTAKYDMCNCAYYFGPKVEAAAQVGSIKIFHTMKAQINSIFFPGISALEWSIDNREYAMGMIVDCRDIWDGVTQTVSYWKEGDSARGWNFQESRRGLIDVY